MTLQSQSALFRHVAAPGRCGATPPPGCGALWRMPQLGKCARATPRQAAGRVARGPADLGLASDLTERRTLHPPPHGKPHSGGVALTEKYTLYAGPHVKPHSARRTSRKGAVCVAARTQNALFGETRRQSALFRDPGYPECAFP